MKSQKSYHKIINVTARKLLMIALLGLGLSAKAQLNPFQAIYFQNPYLYNPSMAGLNKQLDINVGYRQQWSGFPGTPKTATITADYQPTDRVGLGININDDQAGLIRETRVMGTYAYHLPLSGNSQQLHFGLSLGINDARVNYQNIKGDINDEQVTQYNALKAYVDGDFGMAYTDSKLSVGMAIPNLKSVFFKTSDSRFDADRLLFVAIASYKLPLINGNREFMLSPLVGYRVVKGYANIIDGGFNLAMNNYGLYMQAIYHSSQSLGLGFGLDQGAYMINLGYNLETGPLAQYTQGAFEFGLKLRLFRKQ